MFAFMEFWANLLYFIMPSTKNVEAQLKDGNKITVTVDTTTIPDFQVPQINVVKH